MVVFLEASERNVCNNKSNDYSNNKINNNGKFNINALLIKVKSLFMTHNILNHDTTKESLIYNILKILM